MGLLTLTFKVIFSLKVKKKHSELVHVIIIYSRWISDLEEKCIVALLRSLIIFFTTIDTAK